ncbi:toxin-antitoxin system YwqK family antitoxin [Winogradskyella helgolandensis]|uniref:toxin-antitoxin system YwqK family antitoxin n=1 Tax=Winogradskyella helgolandensis TaxID=2697010 RepID=UPI0015CB3991|nr:toxin-antitoxin system YwqK family antitoxin [Winogradskyella helgolandensis]
MKSFIFILFAICCFSCQDASKNNTSNDFDIANGENVITVENNEVLKSDLILNQLEGTWYYNDEPFNGYSVKFHSNDSLQEKLGFHNGKRQGVAKTWSENGVLRIEAYFNQNKLTGVYKSYWENGILALKVNYVDGKKQGEEKQWYSNGEISKIRQLEDNEENGLQKAWLPNGQLYVNYEAKNGRIFGMKRANSCYKLENEIVIRKDVVEAK